METVLKLILMGVLNQALGDGCCKSTQLGGATYKLIGEEDTSSFSCLRNCTYMKEGEPNSKYCFAAGDEENKCMDSEATTARRAGVELQEAGGSGVTGNLIVEPTSQGKIRISGKVYGLEPGTHGFHVHEHGSIGHDCMDAGGHFNPYNTEDHVGDIGTIFTPEDGPTEVDVVDDVITLGDHGFHDIAGLSIVIHGSRELGQGKPRVACGIIV